MTCPYESPEVLEDLAREENYWAGVPVRLWARRFWRAALQHGVVVDVEYPAGLHVGLVEEFVADHSSGRGGDVAAVEIRGSARPAVWQLQHNVQGIRCGFAVRAGGGSDGWGVGVGARRATESDVSYRSLPEGTEECFRDLIGASNGVLSALADGKEKAIEKRVDEYLSTIKGHLQDAGISGWVACRCATEIFQRRGYFESGSENQELVDDVYGSAQRAV